MVISPTLGRGEGPWEPTLSTPGLGLKLILPPGHRARVPNDRMALLKPTRDTGSEATRDLRSTPAFVDGGRLQRGDLPEVAPPGSREPTVNLRPRVQNKF